MLHFLCGMSRCGRGLLLAFFVASLLTGGIAIAVAQTAGPSASWPTEDPDREASPPVSDLETGSEGRVAASLPEVRLDQPLAAGESDSLGEGAIEPPTQFASGKPPERMMAAPSADDTGLIRGVAEDESGLPLSAARVTLRTRDGWSLAHVMTDSFGNFRFRARASDEYLIVVQKEHYRTQFMAVEAGEAANAPLTVIKLPYDETATEGEQRAPWAINTSGPQYTGTADAEPAGSWYFEPWAYNSRTPSQGTSTYYMPDHLALGLGYDFEFDFWQTIEINNAGYPSTPRDVHASDWGFGNAHMQLKYEWLADPDTYHLLAPPTISTSLDLYVPTGNFTTALRPDAYDTDQFSNGAIEEGVNLLLHKRFKPFEIYAEIGDVIADPTRVGPGYTFNNGIASVPDGTYERMVDGNLVWWGAALEDVLDSEHGIGVVMEFTGTVQSSRSLFFGPANAPSYSYVWAVPAIEFNWPSTGSLVMTWGLGVGLPVMQSNFPRTYTPTGTVTIYWNGGGPRGE